MRIIGIDSGLNGGVAIYWNDMKGDSDIGIFPMPTKKTGKGKREIDMPYLYRMLKSSDLMTVVYLEKAQAMPRQGVTSMFSYGMGYGMIKGVISCLCYSYVEVPPQRWQKVVTSWVSNRNPKQRALIAVQDMLPELDISGGRKSGKPHDGIVDALCIMEYGKRMEGWNQ